MSDSSLPSQHLANAARLIFLIQQDAGLAQELKRQIGYFGYVVRHFRDLCGYIASVEGARPQAIILDSIDFARDPCGIAAMERIRNIESLPTLFISDRDDVDSRLRAVHAGCDAYFAKPVDVSALIDKLDQLTLQGPAEPYRVLVMEDTRTLAAHYANILKSAGMVVETVVDPLLILEKLVEFRPDLVLLDYAQPSCDGFELAAVIRQREEFVGVLIVFLSDEADIGRRLFALRIGSDDYLVKPVDPDYLISVVTSRVERSRVLCSFMVRDGLTGLLNHSAIKEQLEIQLARTKRLNGKMSFAMIDIDHFKGINDTYGHSVGDRVLKSLSRLLRQRLRETDIVGRYGGEEFAVILNDTDGLAAMHVLDQIRNDLSRFRHSTRDGEFFITFSAGVADFPSYLEGCALSEAADQGLYQAKNAGRNRIVLVQG